MIGGKVIAANASAATRLLLLCHQERGTSYIRTPVPKRVDISPSSISARSSGSGSTMRHGFSVESP